MYLPLLSALLVCRGKTRNFQIVKIIILLKFFVFSLFRQRYGNFIHLKRSLIKCQLNRFRIAGECYETKFRLKMSVIVLFQYRNDLFRAQRAFSPALLSQILTVWAEILFPVTVSNSVDNSEDVLSLFRRKFICRSSLGAVNGFLPDLGLFSNVPVRCAFVLSC